MKILLRTAFTVFFCLSTSMVSAADMVIGGESTYVVQKKENLYLIGARHGVFWKTIARDNNIDINEPLAEGLVLKLNTRKIVPKTLEHGIIINIPDRTLYFFKDGDVTAFPVGLGILTKNDISDWRTPTGKFHVVGKRKDPTWYVPESIRIENATKGKEVDEIIPPGPNNPLGRYAIETSIPSMLIHATIRPGSVYRYTSHGCIRMLPEHMEQFYPMVSTKTKGEIIYEPVKLAVTDEGTVYLEVRTDVYKKYKSIREYVVRVIEDRGISDRVDWQKIDKLIRDESGAAVDVTLPRAVETDKPTNNDVKISFTRKIIDFFRSRYKKSI